MQNSSRIMLGLIAWFWLAGAGLAQNSPRQQAPPENSFPDRAAAALLAQLKEALQGHSEKKFLAIFDLSRMKDGASFRQEITSFFSQTESISVHLSLAETAVDGDRATAAVDAEMDVEPRNGPPPSRRYQRLSFVALSSGGRWKFIDVQPRSFFSLP